MTVNWFPGHMVKARREIKENAKIVDMVAEILDARAPLSTLNPDLPELVKPKPIIRVLNKSDLADKDMTREFIQLFRAEGMKVVSMDSLTGRGAREVLKAIEDTFQPVAAELLKRRDRLRPARVMVAGVPNVGKSSFLNALARKKIAKTGARPGITRGRQWIRVRDDIDFLDTPGIMWPRVESEEQGLRLALLAIVGEKAYREEDIALFLITTLRSLKPAVLRERYRIKHLEQEPWAILEEVGANRGFLLKGGEVDTIKTARMLLEEFRKGSLGRVTLDEVLRKF